MGDELSKKNSDKQNPVTTISPSSYTGTTANDGTINVVTNTSSSYVGLYHSSGAYNAVITTNPDAGIYHPNGSIYIIAKGAGYVTTQPQGSRNYT